MTAFKLAEKTCQRMLSHIRNSDADTPLVDSTTTYEFKSTVRSRRCRPSDTGAHPLRRNAAHALLGKHTLDIDVHNCMFTIAVALIDKLGIDRFSDPDVASVFEFA